jgi:hypothetical protein
VYPVTCSRRRVLNCGVISISGMVGTADGVRDRLYLNRVKWRGIAIPASTSRGNESGEEQLKPGERKLT